MSAADSRLDDGQLARARSLLERSSRPASVWPALAAAVGFAVAALVFAAVMVTAPPQTHEHPAQARSVD